jgi:hypothetical protein
LDAKVWELTLLATLACLCLGLAWAYEADYFGPVFAVEAALPVSRQFDDRLTRGIGTIGGIGSDYHGRYDPYALLVRTSG